MRPTILILRSLMGIMFLTQLVLGILFWTGNALGWTPIHMTIGQVFVVCLWILALLCWRAGTSAALAIVAIAWGFLTWWLGFAQRDLIPGNGHWVIRVFHALVGLTAMGLAGAMTVRTRLGITRPGQRPHLQAPAVGHR
jgi:hypothetical protein